MRIKGKFSKQGEPFIKVIVSIPAFISRRKIKYFIDTGASHTSLNHEDAESLGIDIEKLPRHRINVTGVGGEVPTHVLKDIYLVFEAEKDN